MTNHNDPTHTVDSHTSLPRVTIWLFIALSIAPAILTLLGVRFDLDRPPPIIPPTLDPSEAIETLHRALAGSFVLTILEWSAVAAGVFAFVLSILIFFVRRDKTPVVGAALLCAAMMDAFHTLASDNLIGAVAEPERFVPFTWALSRLFNVGIIVLGVAILLAPRRRLKPSGPFVVVASLLLGLASSAIILICAFSPWLPQTVYPDSLVSRPFDIAPMLLYLLLAWPLLALWHRREKSALTAMLLVSLVPNLAAQIHVAFFSDAPFDHHFNMARYLKVVAYVAPLTGLVFELLHTYRSESLARSALRNALAEIARSAEELDRFFAVSLDMLCVADHRGFFTRLNPAFEQTLGYSRGELLAKPYTDFIHPDDRESTAREAALLFEGHKTVGFENRYRRKDGQYRWFNWTAAVADSGYIYAAARDITQIKRAHANLSEAIAFSRAIEELGHAINGETDVATILQQVCHAAVEHCAIEDASILFRSPETGRLTASVSTIETQRGIVVHKHIRARGGTQRVLESRRQLVVPDVLNDPELARGRLIKSQGIRSYVGTPVFIGDDVLGVLYALSRTPREYDDRTLQRLEQLALQAATALKNAELFERIREQNVELEQYAFVVSHDLKAPLRAIGNYAKFLDDARAGSLDDDQRQYVSRITGAVREADQFIDDLLALSRLGKAGTQPEMVNPHQLVSDMLDALRVRDQAAISMTGTWPSKIETHPIVLRQIFQNLVSNALKFNESTAPSIEIGCAPREPGIIEFSVSDNGIGIQEKYRQRIFNVFLRLHAKDEYPGTGIGLGIVAKGCKLLGGDVRVESEPGAGTTFHFTINAPIIENK